MFEQAELFYYAFIAALFAVSLVVGRIAGPIFTSILEKLSGKTKSTLDDRIIAAIKVPMESFFFIIVFYFLLHHFPELSSAATFLEKYTLAIIVVLATFLISEATGAAIRWYYEEGAQSSRFKLDLSLLPLLRKVTKIAVYAVGLTIALADAGFDVTGLLAVTSVVGLILGFASQETLANLFAGLALQMDRPYHYGDYLRLPGGELAVIRKIGMRSTRLEDTAHNTIIISNSEFAKMRVTNYNKPDDISAVSIAAEVPLSTDTSRLKSKIASALSAAKPSGLLPQKGYSLSIDSVKAGTIAISFSFFVQGYQNEPKIREIVNRAILDFARKK
ncbi:Small-conductance mechanosensitive channel MscMJ [uncultured archaeon]|nr:Small-conductance mechanosensitive channel MscMJ [uncultured archaeon]